jgi:hypothetical protein
VNAAPSFGAAPFDKADAMPVRAAGSTRRAAPFDKAEASRQLAPEKEQLFAIIRMTCDGDCCLRSQDCRPGERERRPVTLFDFDALLNGRAEIERIGGLGFWT